MKKVPEVPPPAPRRIVTLLDTRADVPDVPEFVVAADGAAFFKFHGMHELCGDGGTPLETIAVAADVATEAWFQKASAAHSNLEFSSDKLWNDWFNEECRLYDKGSVWQTIGKRAREKMAKEREKNG